MIVTKLLLPLVSLHGTSAVDSTGQQFIVSVLKATDTQLAAALQDPTTIKGGDALTDEGKAYGKALAGAFKSFRENFQQMLSLLAPDKLSVSTVTTDADRDAMRELLKKYSDSKSVPLLALDDYQRKVILHLDGRAKSEFSDGQASKFYLACNTARLMIANDAMQILKREATPSGASIRSLVREECDRYDKGCDGLTGETLALARKTLEKVKPLFDKELDAIGASGTDGGFRLEKDPAEDTKVAEVKPPVVSAEAKIEKPPVTPPVTAEAKVEAKPPVTPPVTTEAKVEAKPPVTPPVTTEAKVEAKPPVTPPVTAEAKVEVKPPVAPPVTPPVTPPAAVVPTEKPVVKIAKSTSGASIAFESKKPIDAKFGALFDSLGDERLAFAPDQTTVPMPTDGVVGTLAAACLELRTIRTAEVPSYSNGLNPFYWIHKIGNRGATWWKARAMDQEKKDQFVAPAIPFLYLAKNGSTPARATAIKANNDAIDVWFATGDTGKATDAFVKAGTLDATLAAPMWNAAMAAGGGHNWVYATKLFESTLLRSPSQDMRARANAFSKNLQTTAALLKLQDGSQKRIYEEALDGAWIMITFGAYKAAAVELAEAAILDDERPEAFVFAALIAAHEKNKALSLSFVRSALAREGKHTSRIVDPLLDLVMKGE